MNKFKTFLVMLAFLGLSVNVASAQTETVTFAGFDGVGMIKTLIQNAIDNVHGAGGGTVIINGEKTNVDSKLTFTIHENVTVIWQAEYKGGFDGGSYAANKMFVINGDGVFVIAEGADVEATFHSHASGAFNFEGDVKVKVSGGAVASNGQAIGFGNEENVDFEMSGGLLTTSGENYTAVSVNNGTIKISGGEIKATANSGGAINSNDADIIIFGNAKLSAMAKGRSVVGTGGTVTVSGDPVLNGVWDCISAQNVNISGGTLTSVINTVGVVSTANISGGTITAAGYAVYNEYGGIINISGGTIQTTDEGFAVSCGEDGKININGGTITAIYGNAVACFDNGTANISGGTIHSTEHVAVENRSTGSINISGGTIYSTNHIAVQNYSGTININGGLIQSTNDIAVVNVEGKVNISGGMVRATNSAAIFNEPTGAVNIAGGIVFAYGTEIANIIEGNYLQVGNSVIVGWNEAAGTTSYTAGTSDDIYKLPATATAVWATKESDNGIAVANGTNTGFIPIEGITITVGIEQLQVTNYELQVYPNPTRGELQVTSDELQVTSIEIYDVMGRTVGANLRVCPTSNVINIEHLENGVYFLKIQTDEGVITRKVVKN